MSDITHSSLACKGQLNMSIENALYKFSTITIKHYLIICLLNIGLDYRTGLK